MLKTRVIPCLQLIDESLVKSIKFDKYGYIGDPINTVRIFNELEVDELAFLDIRASVEKRSPNMRILSEIADECFMPLSYGGGIRDFETGKKILSIGFEKLILNTAAVKNHDLVRKLAEHFGNQCVVGSIDIKKNFWGKYQVFTTDGREKTNLDPIAWAQELEALGAGELLLTAMEKEGTWSGYDIEITKQITEAVSIPVIANGGAGSIRDIENVVKQGGASAVAVGSMVVYQKKGMGVLVNFPDRTTLEAAL
jgi:cyclase